MSGYSNEGIALHGGLEQGVSYLQKPFSVEKLARKEDAAVPVTAGSPGACQP